MTKNFRVFNFLFILFLAFCFLFVSCPLPDPDEDDDDDETGTGNGGVYTSRLTLSHNSGLYSNPFSLAMTGREGAKIYYSIDGSIPEASKVGNGRVFEYTTPVSVVNRHGQPNFLATPEISAQFYLVQGDRGGNHPTMNPVPTNDNVKKATIIRAMMIESNGNKSDVVTRTYFIGDNMVRYGNHPVISLVTDPFNLLDETEGIYVRGAAINRWDGPNLYNFRLSGRERERETYFELFDASRNIAVSQGSGIRVRGGWSRAHGQKSFNVYFRPEYGTADLNYRIIPDAFNVNGTPTTRYRDFILRNGGNDAQRTKLRCVYIQSLLQDRNFAIQAGTPCIVYINGEYWGVYNIQERYSDRYVEYKGYANNRNNVIVFSHNELDDGLQSDWDTLQPLIVSIANLDMTVPANYTYFLNMFDLQSYIDYFAAQIYIHNQDWPHNNFRIWRVRSPEPGNPYGDGKWRFMMYDTEFSMGIYSGGSLNPDYQNTFQRILGNGNHNARLFRNLIQNTEFARQFVSTMMDLYNVNFDYNSNIAKLDEMAAVYKPIMQGHVERFGSESNFDNDINAMKSYLSNIRSAMTNNYLPEYFSHIGISAGNLSNVTLNAKYNQATVPGASIKINSVTPNLIAGSWTGQYYSTLPVTVTANVPSGYTFVNWIVDGGTAVTPNSLTSVINFTGNVTITANYSLSSGGITLGGNITLPTIPDSVGYIKLILHDANWSWKSEIDLTPAGNSAVWSTAIAPFSSSTQIFFRVEFYKDENSVRPLYRIDAGTPLNVHSANISNINTNLSASELIPTFLEINVWGYANSPAQMTIESLQNDEFKYTVSTLGNNPWDAAVNVSYPGVENKRYIYRFYARTEAGHGNRTLYAQYYWTALHGSKGASITMTEDEQLFTIYGDFLPSTDGSALQLQCANQLGIFYVRDVTIELNE